MRVSCMDCRKVKQSDGSWEIEETSAEVESSGLCPDCFDNRMEEVRQRKKAKECIGG